MFNVKFPIYRYLHGGVETGQKDLLMRVARLLLFPLSHPIHIQVLFIILLRSHSHKKVLSSQPMVSGLSPVNVQNFLSIPFL